MTRTQVRCWVAAIAGGLATVTLAGQAPHRSANSRPEAASPTVFRPPVLRPPAVPLVAHDVLLYLVARRSATDAATVHWTGRAHPMNSLIRIDGDTARSMGATPANIAALPQTSVTLRPTHTIYTFASARVKETLTFMTPSDLDVLSRPVTYILKLLYDGAVWKKWARLR